MYKRVKIHLVILYLLHDCLITLYKSARPGAVLVSHTVSIDGVHVVCAKEGAGSTRDQI